MRPNLETNLDSKTFKEGEQIPIDYTGYGKNPELIIYKRR